MLCMFQVEAILIKGTTPANVSEVVGKIRKILQNIATTQQQQGKLSLFAQAAPKNIREFKEVLTDEVVTDLCKGNTSVYAPVVDDSEEQAQAVIDEDGNVVLLDSVLQVKEHVKEKKEAKKEKKRKSVEKGETSAEGADDDLKELVKTARGRALLKRFKSQAQSDDDE